MDLSFYALLTVACLVLVLAMWACASSGTNKWGPDLTLELPPQLIQEALFGAKTPNKSNILHFDTGPIPSAPSEKICDPLLTNEHAMAVNDSSMQTFKPRSTKVDLSAAVQVLPKVAPKVPPRPVFSTFKMEQPV